jgi:hypothetical protein
MTTEKIDEIFRQLDDDLATAVGLMDFKKSPSAFDEAYAKARTALLKMMREEYRRGYNTGWVTNNRTDKSSRSYIERLCMNCGRVFKAELKNEGKQS